MRYFLDGPDCAACGRGWILKGLWNFGLEELLSVQRLVSCSAGTWKIKLLREMQMMGAWIMMFQKNIWESSWDSKTIAYLIFLWNNWSWLDGQRK